MSTTEIGRRAENIVAKTLKKQGYTVAAQNWRTRWCEIDIVATKKDIAYFVEVKYRKSDIWGDGIDAITDKKLQQMTFAAEIWVQANNWSGDYYLIVANVAGESPRLLELIEL